MLTVSLLKWWYSKGWGIFVRNLFEKLKGIADFFSFSTIFRTLFAPFRQIDSGRMDNLSLGERFSAFLGRLISRLVGAITRIVIAFAGLIILLFSSIFGLLMVIIWPFIPILPIVGLVLAIPGVISL